jgi:hypothetical protein
MPQLLLVAGGATAMLVVASIVAAIHAASATGAAPKGAIIHRYYDTFTVAVGDVGDGVAKCPKGQLAVNGGYVVDEGTDVYIVASAPIKSGGWYVGGFVPNKIQAPAARPAKIRIVAWCVPQGTYVIASAVDG